jgi:predicted ribosomally synthesized peptide with SipW-like signal peptide
MTDERYQLTRRKALAGLATVGAAGAGAGLGTSALFSDTESFEDNSIQAGTTNLIVQAKVAALSQGLESSDGDVIIEDADGEVDGDAGVGIVATDIKPGDSFVVGFNVIVEDNPMYVAARAANVSNDPGDTTEPEESEGQDNGELGANINTVLGYDGAADGSDANNYTWDQSGAVAPNNPEAGTGGGPTLDSFLGSLENDGFLYQDPDSGEPSTNGQGHGNGSPTELGNGDNVTHWQYFEVPIGVGNEIQDDSISWNVTWYGEQVRNNDPPSGPSAVVDGSVNSA